MASYQPNSEVTGSLASTASLARNLGAWLEAIVLVAAFGMAVAIITVLSGLGSKLSMALTTVRAALD